MAQAPQQQQGGNQPSRLEGLVFEQFNGINTNTTRPGVDDSQMWWCDGFFPLGPRDLRTMYDAAFYWSAPAGKTIKFFDFANIGSTPYMLVVLSDGSIVAVSNNGSTTTTIAPANTITGPALTTVALTQYGAQYVIFVSSQTNGYFVWDGTTFYSPGNAFPGGGTVPTGLSGTSVEVYSGRVWVSNGATVNFSVAGSVVNFATGSGGGSFQSSDSFLRVGFTRLIQTNGFLYLIADSSINYISGVQTTGTPPTTTFTNQNADPEIGTIWPTTVDVVSRNIIFANAFGVHVSYGAAVTKVSEQLDGVYNTAPGNFNGLIPSAAKAIVFGKRVWILLLPIVDPITGGVVNKLFIWDTKKWFTTNQTPNLVYIQHQEINSVLTAYGTDSTNVYTLFQTPSGFTKTVQSKLWDRPVGYQNIKVASRLFGLVDYYNATNLSVGISIDNEFTNYTNFNFYSVTPSPILWFNASGMQVPWTNASGATVTWYNIGPNATALEPTAVGQNGVLTGLTLVTTVYDAAIISLMVQTMPVSFRG